jgi:hypothetical protein
MPGNYGSQHCGILRLKQNQPVIQNEASKKIARPKPWGKGGGAKEAKSLEHMKKKERLVEYARGARKPPPWPL